MADTADHEVSAMQAIAEQLEPLDRAACERVIGWARDRYTRLHFADGDLEGMTRFSDALVDAAKQIGSVTPAEVLRFAQQVVASREAGET